MTDLNEGMIKRSSSFSLPVSKSSDNLTEHAIFFLFLRWSEQSVSWSGVWYRDRFVWCFN